MTKKKQTYQSFAMKFMLTHGFLNREVEDALDKVQSMAFDQLPPGACPRGHRGSCEG